MPLAPIRIGVLLLESCQLLDLAAVDLLHMATPEYLEDCGIPKPIYELGRPCKIHWIGRDGADMQSPVTSNLSIRLTDSMTDPAVAPGSLDALFLPGASPNSMPPAEEYLEFVRQHAAAGAAILAICTGTLIAAHAGLVKNKTVTAPRFLIPQMKKQFPEAKLWDDSVRLTHDGNLWMCGGIINGHDLVAAYLRANYAASVANTVIAAAELAPRAVEYQTGPTRDVAYIVWQLIRALPHSIVRLLKGK
ncbi:uncharacterized protein N7459_000494 [Penicillium hispanicum]|uniref:uncharacterized protein n=1 Tax=Penicillium hispanicum TaxID=1080232 RepID=UPI002541CBD7|nr:uncharacterized protein N7459_000494 [Penicillium hispanicum]KAJ5594286.1 hypothetical protein N7459_000494 [Penicillium hispanicum]